MLPGRKQQTHPEGGGGSTAGDSSPWNQWNPERDTKLQETAVSEAEGQPNSLGKRLRIPKAEVYLTARSNILGLLTV